MLFFCMKFVFHFSCLTYGKGHKKTRDGGNNSNKVILNKNLYRNKATFNLYTDTNDSSGMLATLLIF